MLRKTDKYKKGKKCKKRIHNFKRGEISENKKTKMEMTKIQKLTVGKNKFLKIKIKTNLIVEKIKIKKFLMLSYYFCIKNDINNIN